MKKLAQFKRDAASGMSLELIERYGNKKLPERLQGVRKVIKTNTVGVTLQDQKGNYSQLVLDRASLVEYDGETLVIYDPGRRPVSEQEEKLLHEAEKIYKEYKDTYAGGFWQVKRFFKESPCPWMRGTEFVKGQKYEHNTGLVIDKHIKGEAILRYHVYLEA